VPNDQGEREDEGYSLLMKSMKNTKKRNNEKEEKNKKTD
jgi:hypothetical protein